MRTVSIATGGLTSEQLRLRELEEARRKMLARSPGQQFGAGQAAYGRMLDIDRQIAGLRREMAPAGPTAGAGGFAGEPQFYGVSDWDVFERSLVEEGMAGLRASAGAAGTADSSVFGVAQGQLAAEAQRTRLGLEREEAARRTDWEQREAMRRWQMRETELRRAFDWQRWQQQQTTQREMALAAQRQAYIQFFGAMDERDAWNLLSTLGDAYSVGPPREDINWGQF